MAIIWPKLDKGADLEIQTGKKGHSWNGIKWDAVKWDTLHWPSLIRRLNSYSDRAVQFVLQRGALFAPGPYLGPKNVENRAKKGRCKKQAFSAKNGSLTDFSYKSLISC